MTRIPDQDTAAYAGEPGMAAYNTRVIARNAHFYATARRLVVNPDTLNGRAAVLDALHADALAEDEQRRDEDRWKHGCILDMHAEALRVNEAVGVFEQLRGPACGDPLHDHGLNGTHPSVVCRTPRVVAPQLHPVAAGIRDLTEQIHAGQVDTVRWDPNGALADYPTAGDDKVRRALHSVSAGEYLPTQDAFAVLARLRTVEIALAKSRAALIADHARTHLSSTRPTTPRYSCTCPPGAVESDPSTWCNRCRATV